MSRRRSMLPKISWVLDIPTRPEDMAKRTHNKYAKEALRAVLEHHRDKTLPKHFKRSAHARYGYRQRSARYIRAKQKRYRGGGLDLVKRGQSRQKILKGGKIQMSGSAEGGKKGLSGKYVTAFDFPGGAGRFRKKSRQQVTIEQMVSEVEKILPAESREIALMWLEEYMLKVQRHRSRRRRKRSVKN